MKFLFDQNLSFKLVDLLSNIYPASEHVKALGLKEADGRKIWDAAKNGNFIITSKDSDFHQLSFLYGPPPKVIWISRGNCSTVEIEDLLRNYQNDIELFSANPDASFLEIS